MIDYRRLEKIRKYTAKMGFTVVETRIFETADSTEAMLTLAPGTPAADADTDAEAE